MKLIYYVGKITFYIIVVELIVIFLFRSLIKRDDQDESSSRSIATAVAGMEELVRMEEDLMEILDDYAKELHQRANVIQRKLDIIRRFHAGANNNTEAYLSNPLNSFALVRRMHNDWNKWLWYLSEPTRQDKMKMFKSLLDEIPTSAELLEAIAGIYRLQITYKLKPADMVKGILDGKPYNVSLSAFDSFAIAKELANEELYDEAKLWVEESLLESKNEEHFSPIRLNITQIENLYAAILERNKSNVYVLSDVFSNYASSMPEIRLQFQSVAKYQSDKQYFPICRGEHLAMPSLLYCRYNKSSSAFAKLAPFKMEELQLDPYVVLYHDFIYDNEISQIKEYIWSKLERSTVVDLSKPNLRRVSHDRISKITILYDNETKTTLRINQRIADMTGFNLIGSEPLQVMNYGIGGHYYPHYDYFGSAKGHGAFAEQGDRIASVLVYLSDVEQGGATVFPNINITVHPRKGLALVFYNLDNAGEPDERLMHSACPVLVGSKWVMTKWIRERNQIFTRPCYTK